MSGCALSHNNSLTEIIKSHYMETFAVSSYYTAAHMVIAKLLRSDIKVATLVGATTNLGFYTICIIDHRYAQNDETTHNWTYRGARAAALFFANLQVIKYFSMQDHPISNFWALA
eukprot:Platyproteum_vivax@DN8068_c0_g1_i1.p1